MNATLQNEVLALPPGERAKLIDLLWESLDDFDIKRREAAGAVEAERRIDAINAGKLKTRPADEVFADLRKRLRK
jgi:putative addiction module component (TIGR02574 family)